MFDLTRNYTKKQYIYRIIIAALCLVLLAGCTTKFIEFRNKSDRSQIDSESVDTELPKSLKELRLDWGQMDDYFTISEDKLKLEYNENDGQPFSRFSFLAIPKKNFNGSIYAYLYDEDGVKLCPPWLRGNRHKNFYCPNNKFYISVEGTIPTTNEYVWQQGEVYRGSLLLVENTSKIQFILEIDNTERFLPESNSSS